MMGSETVSRAEKKLPPVSDGVERAIAEGRALPLLDLGPFLAGGE